jgi:serine/threonine protein kinase
MIENALMGLCPDCLLRAGFGTLDTGPGAAGKPAPFVPPTPEELARYFDDLEIIELLGRGGMGAVYKVRQKRLERLVALKILPPNVGQDPSFAERFEREAKALAQLHHPNIVTLYDSGQVDGLFYFFMEFVDGVNLRQMLDTGHISPREALAIVPQICDALQFAHDRGIIHRDIKPENILLNKEGRVKIADFGVAKIVARELSETTGDGAAAPELGRTEAGKVIGTPQYMAPEQLSDPLDVDNRADIYALGVVFYQMLTGELPVGKFERPSSKAQIDVRLDEVVLRALEKKPELRYQQVSEVKTMVETIVSSADIPTVGPGVAAGPASGKLDNESQWCLCYISSPEHLCSFYGSFWYIYEGRGRLRLDAGDLTYSDIKNSLRIPLHSIREIHIGEYSRLAKPLGLDYISITYTAEGNTRTRLFTPCWSPLSLPWETNRLVAEWFYAIQTAVRTVQAGGTFEAEPKSQQNVPPENIKGISTPGSSRMAIMGVALTLFLWMVLLSVPIPARWNGWAFNLFAILGICSILSSQLWRATKPPLKDAPAGPAANPTRLNKKTIWGLCAVFSAILFVNLCQWLKNYEPEGVWIPNAVDASVSGEYGEALIHVTEVSQNGQVVLIKLVCDTPYPDRGLYVQYSGQIFDYPADVVSSATNVDCLVAPRFMSGNDKVLAGTTLLKGKPAYQIGFVLPDAATAAKVVEQVKRVHLGKPRQLDQNKSSLLLFSLYRSVGEKASGEPVREGLDGMLVWQPKQNSAANPKLADASHSEPNVVRQVKAAPFVARLPDGGYIELLAVRLSSSTNQPWWRPDGSPSTYESSIEAADKQLGSGVMALVRVKYPLHHDEWPRQTGEKNPVEIDLGTPLGLLVKDGRQLPMVESETPTYQTMFGVMSFEQALSLANETTLPVKVAAQDWMTLTTQTPGFLSSLFSSSTAGKEWTFSETAVGALKVTVDHLAKRSDMEYRFVAIDNDGQEHNPSISQTTHTAGDVYSKCVVTFEGVGSDGPLLFKNFREVRLEARPYQNVEFRNVSLQPGHKTTVEVKDFGDENQSAQTMPTTPTAAQNPSFGPVMEHVLPADKDGLTPLFDLDNDKLVPDPGPGDTTGGLARLFSSGVAVMRDEAKGQTVLMGMAAGTVTESVRPEQWDTTTAAEAALAMNSFIGRSGMGVITSAVALGKLPQTFLFKTSSGKIGLWQVEEFTDNPHSVKIRYKLVR